MEKNKNVVVIGGGIVGVCAALETQLAGHQVTLIDPKTPGRETSYGNAGVLSESSVVVLNNPQLLKALPKLLLNKSNGFRYNPLFVLKYLGWSLKFLSYSSNKRAKHAARALKALMDISLDRHKALIKEAGVDELLRYAGWFKTFRKESTFKAYSKELELMDEVGVRYSVYEQDQIRQIEPGLSPIYVKAVLMDDTCGVTNPAKLTDAYVRLFEAAGGVVREDKVAALANEQDWQVTLASGEVLNADDVVLAAGGWSAEIASWLGYRIPMAWERGYHWHLEPGEGMPLGRAIYDIDGGFVMAPMQQGVRITTGVEFNDRDAPPNFRQAEDSVADARANHGLGKPIEEEPWMGRRPTLIDSLPMIGAAPRHPGLWFDFGHQHIGLSMGPGSGRVIAALISGGKAPIDIMPFRAERFPL